MTQLQFLKVHGAGNDFVLLDGRTQVIPEDLADLAVRLCDRRLGVGADGLLVVGPARQPEAAAAMHIQNSDGSYAEMCGNGLRCVARYLLDASPERNEVLVETGAGPLQCRAERTPDGSVARVRVDMGRPILAPGEVPVVREPSDPEASIPAAPGPAAQGPAAQGPAAQGPAAQGPAAPASTMQGPAAQGPAAPLVRAPIVHPSGARFVFTAVSMGNPHAVLFVGDAESGGEAPAALARRFGPGLEAHPRFPRKANISFVRPEAPGRFRAAVWERGAGLTAACGTGAAAIGVAAVLEGRTPAETPITVALPGGELTIEVASDFARVHMTGPATVVYRGTVDLAALPAAAASRQLTALLAAPAPPAPQGT